MAPCLLTSPQNLGRTDPVPKPNCNNRKAWVIHLFAQVQEIRSTQEDPDEHSHLHETGLSKGLG